MNESMDKILASLENKDNNSGKPVLNKAQKPKPFWANTISFKIAWGIIILILLFSASAIYYFSRLDTETLVSSPAISPSASPEISLDSDSDGLPDRIEKILGTDSMKADSDGDTYSDLSEIKSGYDPLYAGTAGKYSPEDWQEIKDKIKKADVGFYDDNFSALPVVSPSPSPSQAPLSFVCGTTTVKDVDSNVYKTVKIGEQCWLKENLKVTKNSAGEAITRYCYDNDSKICDTDGGLYDWNTAMNKSTTEGAQGICPSGWHVPKDSEWYVLESGLAVGSCEINRSGRGCDQAGTKLKLGVDSIFYASLTGYRDSNNSFYHRGIDANFWSSTESGTSVLIRGLYLDFAFVYRNMSDKAGSISVRCLKD